MDELIRLVVTSKAYTEALNSGITVSMNIINGWEDYFSKSWLIVRFAKNYHLAEHVFDAEEYEKMISPEIAAGNVLKDMKEEVERDGR